MAEKNEGLYLHRMQSLSLILFTLAFASPAAAQNDAESAKKDSQVSREDDERTAKDARHWPTV